VLPEVVSRHATEIPTAILIRQRRGLSTRSHITLPSARKEKICLGT
jgi:hypothetical protein